MYKCILSKEFSRLLIFVKLEEYSPGGICEVRLCWTNMTLMTLGQWRVCEMKSIQKALDYRKLDSRVFYSEGHLKESQTLYAFYVILFLSCVAVLKI